MGEPAHDSAEVFDFAALVYDLYINWQMALCGVQRISPLLHELGRFSAALPPYIDATADEALIDRLLALQEAIESVRNAVKVADFANDEIYATFARINSGIHAVRTINEAADRYGYGTA